MTFIDVIYSIDYSILDFIQNTIKCALLDPVMAFFSYIGESGAIWIASSLVMLFFKRTRAMGVMVLAAMSAGYLIGEIGIKILCAVRGRLLSVPALCSIFCRRQATAFRQDIRVRHLPRQRL